MKIFKKIFDEQDFNIFFLSLFPIVYIAGSAILNFYLILISIYVLYNYQNFFKLEKEIKKFYIYLFFFVFVLSVISILNEGFGESFIKTFSQMRFILFSLFIILIIKKFQNLKFLINLFIFLGLLVSLDVIYQDTFNFNLLGYERLDTRLTGIFNDEEIVGGFLFKLLFPIILLLISFRVKYFKNIILNNVFSFLFFGLIVYSIILSGERTVTLLLIIFFVIYFLFFDKKKLLIFLIFILISLSFNIKKETYFKKRYFQTKNDIINYSNSHYILLQKSGLEVWKKNIVFGSGINNFSTECNKQDLAKIKLETRYHPCSTHPHNTLVEILSETGLIGFSMLILIFFQFIRILKIKNYLNLNFDLKEYFIGLNLVLLTYLIPLVPTGSFFSTMNASFFWFSLGLVISIVNIYSKNFN